ncbi:MAG: right-handed parallel beta-helix repeat-containing protein [Bacteroidales bacterium]|nr:right-handed parallel beta-helix repeat-containing protein [Bacteroidales bacterium]
MKTLIISLFIICTIFLAQKQSIGQQFIENDTIWSSDTVRIYNDIVVEYPAILTINPGVYVEFQDNYSIDVYGKLIAIGSGKLPIIFTIADTNSFGDTATLAGGWGGIKFLQNQYDTSIINYCHFYYGKAVDPGTNPLTSSNENLKGGAIYCNVYSHLEISNSMFAHNRSIFSGGAVYAINLQSLIIRNNYFISNSTLQYGGALWINKVNKAEVSNNIFRENQAVRFSENAWGTAINGVGAAIWLGAQTNNSVIFNNMITNNISPNAALYETSYNCSVFNNIIANNRGPGSMIGHSLSVSSYINNTIVNNKGFSHNKCGIVFFSNNILMRNNIVHGNTSDYYGYKPIQIYSFDLAIADFAYSCIPDEAIYYQGEGNIQDDPQFVNPTPDAGPDYDGLSADWSLLDSSPCVNTGTPDTSGLNLPATDLRGNPRIYGIRIDMGAIENQTVVGLPENLLVNARVQVSPNPFGQSFKVISPGREKISSFRLFNQKGQQIGMETLMPMDQILVFDLGYQPPGLYLLVTRFEDGTSETTKLVKY